MKRSTGIGPSEAMRVRSSSPSGVMPACAATAAQARCRPRSPEWTGSGPSWRRHRGSRAGDRAGGRVLRRTGRGRSRCRSSRRGSRAASGRLPRDEEQHDEEQEALGQRLVDLAGVAGLRTGAGKDDRPGHVGDAPQSSGLMKLASRPRAMPIGATMAARSMSGRSGRELRRAKISSRRLRRRCLRGRPCRLPRRR